MTRELRMCHVHVHVCICAGTLLKGRRVSKELKLVGLACCPPKGTCVLTKRLSV